MIYQFCESWGLKLRERGDMINLYLMETYLAIRILCKPISKSFGPTYQDRDYGIVR